MRNKDRVSVFVYEVDTVEICASIRLIADRTPQVTNADTLLEQIREAVSDWIQSDTNEAPGAWEYAGKFFNLGDFMSYVEDEQMQIALRSGQVCDGPEVRAPHPAACRRAWGRGPLDSRFEEPG